MKKFYAFRDLKKEMLSKHEFFSLLSSDKVPLRRKLEFAPIMAHFIMNFRDMNKWVIRFRSPKNEYENIINGGTTEDETHSKLFLEDWRKLHMDDLLQWEASDVIHWLFLSNEMECFRGYGVDFMKLCIDDNSHPLLRYAHSESGETCGNIFFSSVSPIADLVAKELNVQLRYFGSYHLDLENGHVWKSEGIFEKEHLDTKLFKKAIQLSDRMFAVFNGIFNAFHTYANDIFIKETKHPSPPLKIKTGILGQALPKGLNLLECNSNSNIISHIENHLTNIDENVFFRWLATSKIAPLIKIKSFIPLWIVDIMGYRDLNKYIFSNTDTPSFDQHLISEYVQHLSEHSKIFYNDWISLNLNENLRWTASDTLEFIFLNTDMDTHRKNLVDFSMCGLKYSDPIIRFWFILILELSGKAFFSSVGKVAQEAELKHGLQLDYLNGRHSSKEEIDAFYAMYNRFHKIPLTQEQQKIVIEIADMVFDALNINLNISFKYASENLLAAR